MSEDTKTATKKFPLDTMGTLRRTNYCTDITTDFIEKEVIVCGFTQRIRDKGNLVFIDLRDRTGIIQLTFDDQTQRDVFEKAKLVKNEFVLMAKGLVKKRSSVNSEIKTGEIEIFATELKILSVSQTPPFPLNDNSKINEEIRLKYRYLDLRRSELQQNIIKRHKIAKVTRDYFYDNDFLEIETPMMIKSTPEGARDYIVPSRVHNGKFYALPQSPQIYKQLLMVSGFDRYIQLARCFRDEDLRADRQPEFTQIDLEMSFVDTNDILKMVEGYVEKLFLEILGEKIELPLKRLTYNEAMNKYGCDKPDTRFDMFIQDITETVSDCEFPVFKNAIADNGKVCAIVAKNGAEILTRKAIDKLVEQAKGIGAKGVAYIRFVEDAPSCSFGKFLKDGELEAIMNKVDCQKGDVVLIVADKAKITFPVLGQLRLTVARQLDIICEGFNFLWITEFPFFEFNEETGKYDAMHHPFTMPLDECIQYLDTDPSKVYAKAYDLVLNGTELSSGSIRITDNVLQEKMFKSLGLTSEEIEAKFGFLVEAYKFAAPPHGGMGIGLDRLSMIMCNAESLKDVTAFPKVQNASELMSNCPGDVDTVQLQELGIQLAK